MRVVYFVQPVDGGLVKIGSTDNLNLRLSKMQTDSPLPLRLLGSSSAFIESELHARFAPHRRHREWFEPVPVLLEIAASCGNARLVIRPRRERAMFRGIPIGDLARQTGIDLSLLGRYARGEVAIGVKNAPILAAVLGVAAETLLWGEAA